MSIADTHMNSLHSALDGLAVRAEMRSNNVANAETPGYQARTIDFESALADAIARGRVAPGGGAPDAAAIADRGGLPDIHGNTVDLEVEIVEMMTDNLLVSALSDSYTSKVNRWRTAMGRA